MLTVDARFGIPLREISFQFVRSSGPGGQNVNKVSSKAVLRWNVKTSTSLPPDVKRRFLARYQRRITRDGEILIASQRFRDQGRNIADCLEKLRRLLADVATAPAVRKRTAPGQGAKERRLRQKKALSDKKRTRGKVRGDDG